MTYRRTFVVLDAGAVAAYAGGATEIVGEYIAACEPDEIVALPTVCLAEAYSLVGHHDVEALRRLKILLTLPVVRAVPLLPGACRAVGLLRSEREVHRLGLAHTVVIAVPAAAPVITSSPFARDLLGDDWPIVEV